MFKVEYSKYSSMKLMGAEKFETLPEAMNFAKNMVKSFKNRCINIYDLNGPGNSVWLVGGYDKTTYYPNDNYKRNGKR